jgi:hypothetical protein
MGTCPENLLKTSRAERAGRDVVRHRRMYRDHEASLAEWIHVLDLAKRFGFPRVQKRAIIETGSVRFRQDLGPVQKIVYAKKYNVPDWLPECYEALCQRQRGLEDSEAKALGTATTNQIWKAREAVRASCVTDTGCFAELLNLSSPPIDWDLKTYDMLTVAQIVKNVFKLPSSVLAPKRTNTAAAVVDSILESPIQRRERRRERMREKHRRRRARMREQRKIRAEIKEAELKAKEET